MRKPVKHGETHVEKPVYVPPAVAKRNVKVSHLITDRSTRHANAVTTQQPRTTRDTGVTGKLRVPTHRSPPPVPTISSHPQTSLEKSCRATATIQSFCSSLINLVTSFGYEIAPLPILPVTKPQKRKTGKSGLQKATLKKYIAIHSFLMKQTKAVPHSAIKQEIGSSCSPQLKGLSGSDQWNLTEAQIVSRTQRGKAYFWKLTEFGRAEGLAVIKSLKDGYTARQEP